MEDKSFHVRKKSPLILALDVPDLDQALLVADKVRDHVDIVKIGLQLFSAEGPAAVSALRGEGFEIFLDIKMSDIPNTVASACLAVCRHEPAMLTLHTMGGQEMMRAAASVVESHCASGGIRKPLLIGVTLLTSFDLLALRKIGVHETVEGEVTRLAELAAESGMDGLVASPLETLAVRRKVGEEMIIVTPGVRPAGATLHDQKRVGSPADAIRAGADFIVVGRPLCRAEDPAAVARAIVKEVEDARG